MNGLWHPSGERLSALLDGEITDWDRARVLAHVERCPDCAAAIEAEEQVTRALGALRAVPVPMPDLLQRSLLALGDPAAAAGRPAAERIPVTPHVPRIQGSPRHRAAPALTTGVVRTASDTAPHIPVTSRRPRAPRVGGRPGAGPRRRSAPARRRVATASVLSIAGLGLAFVSVLPATAARTRSVATAAVAVLGGTQATTTVDAGGAERQLGRPGPSSLSTAVRVLFSTLDPLSAASSTGLPRAVESPGWSTPSTAPTPVSAGGSETVPGLGGFATTSTTSITTTADADGSPTFATAGPGEVAPTGTSAPTDSLQPTSSFQPPGTPTATASPDPSAAPDPSGSPDPTGSPVPAPLVPTSSPAPTGSPTPSPVPTNSTGVPTPIPTASSPADPTPTPVPDPSATPTGTGDPSASPDPSVSPDPSDTDDPSTTQAAGSDDGSSTTAAGSPSPSATPSVPTGVTGGAGFAP